MKPISALVFIAVLLGGCGSDSPEAMLEDYLGRVENTLDLELATGDPYLGLPTLPGKRHRRLEVVELRTGMLETLDLRYCQLLPLIAERNSILGRVMKPSTTLAYELRFFDQLQACYLKNRQTPLKDRQFSELLNRIYRIKAENLPHVVWNGIFTSESLEKNLTLAAEPLPLEGNPGYGDSLRALDVLAGISEQAEAVSRGEPFILPMGLNQLERHYEALYRSEYGSQLIKSLALLSHYLNRAATTLEAAIARRPLCYGGPSEQARILKNVFDRYYAARVQPYMAQVHRQGEPWMVRLAEMLHGPELQLPEPMQDYRRRLFSEKAGLWTRYQQAIKRHTRAWQDVLRQCGLMPRGGG